MTSISEPALALLRELAIIPQVIGFDHRIAELDEARLITWVPGEGYFIAHSGIDFLSKLDRAGHD